MGKPNYQALYSLHDKYIKQNYTPTYHTMSLQVVMHRYNSLLLNWKHRMDLLSCPNDKYVKLERE
jgi:hypothetical protein